jgi:hypothetical protein
MNEMLITGYFTLLNNTLVELHYLYTIYIAVWADISQGMRQA